MIVCPRLSDPPQVGFEAAAVLDIAFWAPPSIVANCPGGACEGSWPAGQPQGNDHQKFCLRRSLRQRRLRVREALDDHFSNGDKLRPPAAFEKHRDEIEALARRKYLCDPLEPDRSFSFALPKSHEILQPPNLHYDRK